jgi:threonyl-tRNA synthetase
MRLLLIHSDYLEFEAKQPTPAAEEIKERGGRFEECLVVFVTVEERDEINPEIVAEKAATEIEEVLRKVGAPRVVLYPYAHLSSSLASPSEAVKILELVKEKLVSRGHEVARLPFGWYKSFKLSCKGHPLSELSREIVVEEAEKPSKQLVTSIPSEYLLLEPDGSEHKIELENLNTEPLKKYPDLKQFLLSEELGQRSGKEPAHIKLMRRLELVDYEPASDVGHFRFYPNGLLVKELLQEFATQLAIELGAMRVETPVMYRESEPDIAEQASRFYQKDYRIKLPNYSLLLRFAGDFGLFKMMKDTVMSYKQLPVRIFELSPSYRLEQSGECVGLKRLRAFTMPDLHCFCAGLEQALDEYKLLFKKYFELTKAMQIDFLIVFRVTKEFYKERRDFILELLRFVQKPALVEVLEKPKHYWVMKHEFQFIDSVGGNAQLATVQLDLEDSARYGIGYVDRDGKKKGCVILHSSMGSIERWIYALLEQAAKNSQTGNPPSLPVWLSPTQVRFLPVSEKYVEPCLKNAKYLTQHGVRADVDDREMTIAKKVREAEMDWVPFIVVLGEKEEKSRKLSVRVRGEKETKSMTLRKLLLEVKKRTEGKPFRPPNLPLLLSQRPVFVSA